jgi:predicted Rossmann fold flavoprotein
MLWTHFGISGPVVLDASGLWHRARLNNRAASIAANLIPGDDFQAAEARLFKLAETAPRLVLKRALAMLLPARLADAILARLGIGPQIPMAHFAREDRRKLIHALLEWPLPVTGSRGFAYAEVTAGGVPLEELDAATMESRKCAGLFLVGEILNVDGRIGGFNFQWAWSSGFAAGRALAAAYGESGAASATPQEAESGR